MLEFKDRFWIEEMRSPVSAPLKFSADLQRFMSITRNPIQGVRANMSEPIFFSNHINAHTTELAERASEIFINKLLG